LLIEIKFDSKVLVIGKIYAPNKDEPNFLDSLFGVIVSFSTSDLILGRDWNLVLQNRLDKNRGQKHSNINAKERLKAYMQLLNLSDLFVICILLKNAYTRIQS